MPRELAGVWQTWKPTEKEKWDVARVVHLHRRAGFGATWSEIQRDFADGPEAAVNRILRGGCRLDGVPDDFQTMANVIGEAAAASTNPGRLKAWWIYRMLFSPDPLTEKLTLMWHNHFATSNHKVADLPRMHIQNEILRKHARGPFSELLKRVVQDSAMLVWLDAGSNRRGRPNENLARELMELFTLGIGNYGERDVKESARALTGWSIRGEHFFQNVTVHDSGEKSILGRAGRWNGDDLLKILLEHPATSRRIAWRLSQLFLGETVPAADLESLATGLRENDLSIEWAVSTILRSRAFFATSNLGSRVSSPVEFALAGARSLECFEPPVSTLTLAERIGRLGQDLFYPPNVGGWSGGRNWLSTRSVIGRANLAAELVSGKLTAAKPLDLNSLADDHGSGKELKSRVAFFNRLLTGGRLKGESFDRDISAVDEKDVDDAEKTRWGVAVMLALPEAQLI